jgi:hypothetical protein
MNFREIYFDGPAQRLLKRFSVSLKIKVWMFFYEKAGETMYWEPAVN